MSLLNRIVKSPLTKVSILKRGVWTFVPVPTSNALATTQYYSLYQTPFEFGLVTQKQTNPSNIAKFGSKSDLLVVYNDLTLGIMPLSTYKRQIENPQLVVTPQPITSTSKDRNKKLEEQGQKLVPPLSYTEVTPRATKLSRPKYNPKDERGSRY